MKEEYTCDTYPSLGKKYNGEKAIISLTSHSTRLKHVGKTIYSIIMGSENNIHIVLTVYKDDINNFGNDLNILIQNNIIELIISDKDFGPHLKYFYTMKKYKNTPIITIDDDGIYHKDTVKILLDAYNHNLNEKLIFAKRVHKILIKNNEILPYNSWHLKCTTIFKPSHFLFATGVGAVLYPPNILSISDINIPEILKCKYADDIYLKVLELRQNIKVKWVQNDSLHPDKLQNSEVLNIALEKINVYKNRNDTYISEFISDFKKLTI